jgi:hypothetical protein
LNLEKCQGFFNMRETCGTNYTGVSFSLSFLFSFTFLSFLRSFFFYVFSRKRCRTYKNFRVSSLPSPPLFTPFLPLKLSLYLSLSLSGESVKEKLPDFFYLSGRVKIDTSKVSRSFFFSRNLSLSL